MENNQTKVKKGTIKLICIVLSYIILYSLLGAFVAVTEGNTVAFIIFAAVMCVFSYKACKSFLVDTLSALPWPVFLVLTIVISCLVGVVVAPYHIGKWTAKKIETIVVKE